MAALDGVRALAAMSILAGHCMFALGFAWPERHQEWYAALEAHPWMLALVNLSEPAMDMLLILSGFLTAHSLLPAVSRKGRSPVQMLLGYYKRRALRIVPSYYATLAFVRLVFLRMEGAGWGDPDARRAIFTLWFNRGDGCPQALWANFLFANNQLERAGCMKYAWSQAVQVQFYLAFPVVLLLLRPRTPGTLRRLAAAAGLVILAVTAYRAAIAVHFRLPVPVFGPLGDPEMVALMTHTLKVSYYSLVPRLTHLSFGVLGACAVMGAGGPKVAASKVNRRKGLARTGAAAAAALLGATLFSNRFGPEPDPQHPMASPQALIIGVAGVTGMLQPAALTYLVIFAALGTSRALSKALSWRGWRLIAAASYNLYLLHPMIMLAVWSLFPPANWFVLPNPSPLGYVAVTAAVFFVSLAAACAHDAVWSSLLGKQMRA